LTLGKEKSQPIIIERHTTFSCCEKSQNNKRRRRIESPSMAG
jgi:hypothetical protein